MADDLLAKFRQKVINTRGTVELEVRFYDGTSDVPFSGVSAENFQRFLDSPIFKNMGHKTVRSLTFTVSGGKHRYEVAIDSKKKIGKVILVEKTKIATINVEDAGIRVGLSEEVPVQANQQGRNNKQSMGSAEMPATKSFRYRERISLVTDEFPDWRFDLTKVYQKQLEVPMEAEAIISREIPFGTVFPPVLPTAANSASGPAWKYEIEAEYTKTATPTQEDLEAIKLDIARLMDLSRKTLARSPEQQARGLIRLPKNQHELMNNVYSLKLEDLHALTRGYSVTEKADGKRVLLFFNGSESHDVYEIMLDGTAKSPLVLDEKVKTTCLIDAEYLADLNRYLLFDLLVLAGEDYTDKPFAERYSALRGLVEGTGTGSGPFAPGTVNVQLKRFLFPGVDFGEGQPSIFAAADQVYHQKYDYYVDGLIFTAVEDRYYTKTTYKWKPPHDLTIDFLIKLPVSGSSGTVVTKDGMFKIVELYFILNINQWKKMYMRPAGARPYNQLVAERFGLDLRRLPEFFPYPFVIVGEDRETVDASHFKAKIKIEEIGVSQYDNSLDRYMNIGVGAKKIPIAVNKTPMIPILDGMVVEFAFIGENWQPYRFRKDKTRKYFEGLKRGDYSGPNGFSAAMNNWDLIQHPVTEDLIFGKVPLPEQYYINPRNANKKTGELAFYMYKFNNYVKKTLYDRFVKQGDRVLELAGGRGGDVDKAHSATGGKGEIVLIDVDGPALKVAEERYGRKARYLQMDLNAVGLTDVVAGLEAVKIRGGEFDVVSCQFAFHYFMATLKSLKNIAGIVDGLLKSGGIFMFTALDGATVFKALKNKTEVRYEKEGKPVAVITRKWEPNTNKRDTLKGYGQVIDVFVEKIGLTHPEYLLNFEYVIKYFVDKLGYELVESKMFSATALTTGYGNTAEMSEAERSYAGLNRYAVLRKP